MKTQRRTNFIWGLVALAVGIIVVLRALDVLPAGVADLALRAWPALLVIVGLGIFLRERVPLGSLIGLVVGLVLVGGLATAAFSARATQQRSDYQVGIDQPIASGTNLIRVHVVTLATDVEISRSLNAGGITGNFTGSTESLMTTDYVEKGDGTADLTLTETRPNSFPMLEALGRGALTLELPAGIALDVSVTGAEGNVVLNTDGLSIERMNLNLTKGNSVVTLPAYKPLGSASDASLGALVVADGTITLRVPPDVAARFTLNRGGTGLRPVFDSALYNLLDEGDGVLEARNFDGAEIQLRYNVTTPRGLITVETSGG